MEWTPLIRRPSCNDHCRAYSLKVSKLNESPRTKQQFSAACSLLRSHFFFRMSRNTAIKETNVNSGVLRDIPKMRPIAWSSTKHQWERKRERERKKLHHAFLILKLARSNYRGCACLTCILHWLLSVRYRRLSIAINKDEPLSYGKMTQLLGGASKP